MGTKRGYYDIEVAFEDAMVENGMIDGLFYLRDLKQRKLFLNEDVSSFSVAEIVKHIMLTCLNICAVLSLIGTAIRTKKADIFYSMSEQM